MANELRRHTADDGIGFDVPCDDCACGDDRALTDGDAGENGRTNADPDIVADDDRPAADVFALR